MHARCVSRSAAPELPLDEFLCRYTMPIRFTWHEPKRHANLRKDGFDFADARRVFGGATCTVEDDRFNYVERRFITVGLLEEHPELDVKHIASGIVRVGLKPVLRAFKLASTIPFGKRR